MALLLDESDCVLWFVFPALDAIPETHLLFVIR